MSAIKPTSQTELIVDEFIRYANQHLTTVSGLITTISTYPPAGTPGPGIIPWTGYFVPPSVPTPPLPDTVSEIDTSEYELTPEQNEIADRETLRGQPINNSYAVASSGYDTSNDGNGIQSNYSTIEEYVANSPMPYVPSESMPISGIEQIPNYETKIKVPPELVLAMRKYGVGKTPVERAHFLAQVAHESMNFFYKEEIASGKAYEGRRDLGNVIAGDGMRFKGRGYIQLTGRENYTKFSPLLGANIVANPLLVSQRYYADVSCLFWKVRGLKSRATQPTYAAICAVTKIINGGENGLADRVAKFKKYWIELQRNPNLWI